MSCLRSMSRTVLIPLMLLLAACGRPEPSSGIAEALGDISFSVPEGARTGGPTALGDPQAPRSGAAFPAETYGGRQPFGVRRSGVAAAERVTGGVQVNFDGADVREVVKVILGDILGATYTIDPALSGEVVLSSAGPLTEQDLIAVLESVIAQHGGVLVRLGENAYAVRLAEGLVTGSAEVTGLAEGGPLATSPGTGITIVPLRYISAANASQFIQPLVTAPEQIRIDETRNLLLFVGSGAERRTVLETLRDLDVNWMAGRSVGIFPLAVATPESIIPELESLFTPLSAPDLGTGTIRFLPVARLNAVLAVAQGRDQIQEVARWVERLDRGSQQDIQFFVYQLQHAPAVEVAQILGETLGEATEGIATGGADALDPSTAGVGFGASTLDPESPSAFEGEGGFAQPQGFDQGGLLDEEEQDRMAALQGYGGTLRTGTGGLGDLGPVRIVPNTRNNSLLIRATPRAYELIEATLRRLDTAPLQVLIEATIAEVALNDRLRYGVQYFLETGDVRAGFNTSSSVERSVGFGLLEPLARLPGFNFIYEGGNAIVAIDALASVSDVRVLSSPSVVVQDNRLATLLVGDQVPIITRTAQSVLDPDAPVVNSIEYRDTGVILKVRPRISSNENVSLEIGQEVSRIADVTTTVDSPVISQRRITSEVNVLSGQTVVLGGLIQDSESVNRDKVPLLGDIPLLGNLFRYNNRLAGRTELIVFLTPRIIRNAQDARDVSEELRARMRSLRPMGAAAPATVDDRPITLPGDPVRDPPRRLPAPTPPVVPAPDVEVEPLPPGAALDAPASPLPAVRPVAAMPTPAVKPAAPVAERAFVLDMTPLLPRNVPELRRQRMLPAAPLAGGTLL